MKIEIDCCLCPQKHIAKIDLPEGWAHRYDEVNDEQGFCPKHASISAFATHQCPGCVGGWGDCDLWSNFAYAGRRNLGPKDFEKLEAGICPRRTNGTIGVTMGGGRLSKIEDINLSDRAPAESGKALAQAIRDYWKRYSKEFT